MDLILWRHAEAEDARDGLDDLQRALTARGEKQAARVAAWLDRLLPEGTRVLCSPARRCEQTVLPLGRKYKVHQDLAPGASAAQILQAAHWPQSRNPVLLVGHQPTLGEAIAQLLCVGSGEFAVRKGSAWWLRLREREGDQQCVVVAVQSPDAL